MVGCICLFIYSTVAVLNCPSTYLHLLNVWVLCRWGAWADVTCVNMMKIVDSRPILHSTRKFRQSCHIVDELQRQSELQRLCKQLSDQPLPTAAITARDTQTLLSFLATELPLQPRQTSQKSCLFVSFIIHELLFFIRVIHLCKLFIPVWLHLELNS